MVLAMEDYRPASLQPPEKSKGKCKMRKFVLRFNLGEFEEEMRGFLTELEHYF